MELQKLLKGAEAFRFQQRKAIELDPERYLYINEIRSASPLKPQSIKTEIAEIPHNLGKSEKFSNKLQIENALKFLQCLPNSRDPFRSSPKSSSQDQSQRVIPLISVDHHFHKKNYSPFSPGVVRIKSKELGLPGNPESAMRTTASLRRTSQRFCTPQPPVSSSVKKSCSPIPQPFLTTTQSISPNKQRVTFFSSPEKKLSTPKPGFLSTNLSFFNPSSPSSASPNRHAPKQRKEAHTKTGQVSGKSIPAKSQVYFGGYNQGLKDGYGELTYSNGDWYKGNFKRNLKDGTGKYYCAKYGVKYKGEFKEDLRSGLGFLVFDSGDRYKCNWNRGVIESLPIHIKYRDGSEYYGESKYGKRHGVGKIEYRNGGVYQGHWENDQRSGQGVVIYKAEVFFEGFFAGDYTDGPGVLVRKNTFNSTTSPSPVDIFQATSEEIEKPEFFNDYSGFPRFNSLPLAPIDQVFITLTTSTLSKYIDRIVPPGRFLTGKLTGAGMAKYGILGTYYGSFLEGKRSGYGKMEYTDPDHLCEWFPETEGTYIGEWRDDKRHGPGKMTWTNGIVYEGKYAADRRHNVVGKITFLNGDVYEGGWVDDIMEGSCTMHRKGVAIRGQFVKGVLSSFARIEYSDGKVYEGDLFNNKPHGAGKMKWVNENVYEGNFCDGVIEGMGRMIFSNGDVYEGNWENGKRNGKGSIVYAANKQRYNGDWVDGKRSGEGVLKNQRGDVIKVGYWSNDELI